MRLLRLSEPATNRQAPALPLWPTEHCLCPTSPRAKSPSPALLLLWVLSFLFSFHFTIIPSRLLSFSFLADRAAALKELIPVESMFKHLLFVPLKIVHKMRQPQGCQNFISFLF